MFRSALPWVVGCCLLLAAPAPVVGQKAQSGPASALPFRSLGPAVAGGRVTAVAGVPGNPLIYYAGAAGGGVWKSDDGGISWRSIFDREPDSIGAIALAPSNPNLVWVGTGEANLRDDVITGHGVYFSPDAGASWRYMGLGDAGQISSIVVDPHDPNRVWVGVFGNAWRPSSTRGVYRTTDGGRTWQRVLFVNDTTGVASLILEPGNPRVLLAAMWQAWRRPWALRDGGPASAIYRSRDGGLTWRKLSAGLPLGPLGRIGLAAAPSDPTRIYALIEARRGRLWVSRDLGSHWREVNNNHALDDRPWYFSFLAVAPHDPDRVFFLASGLYESNDGGRTARRIGAGLHGDYHVMWIAPGNSGRILEGSDGGVALSLDGGRSWRFLADLPIEQFYQVAADTKVAFDVCGGLQDNSAWCGPSRVPGPRITGADWFTVTGGDGQYAVPAPSNPDIIYTDAQNGRTRRVNLKTRTARVERPTILGVRDLTPSQLRYRFNWTAPLAVSTTDANTVYLAGNALFKSTDGGRLWRPISPDLTRNSKARQITSGGPIEPDISGAVTFDTILSFGLAPGHPRTIWVGTDDGLVQVTRDGGRHWANVTPPGLPPWGRVHQIAPSPFDPASCYLAMDFHETGNERAYAFKTHDYGRTWTNIAASLPPHTPVRVVREDPDRRGFLVAGTSTGLYYSRDDGAHWGRFTSLPTVTVTDLKFVPRSHSLVVATHGRGLFVLDNLIPLEDAPPPGAGRLYVFPTVPAYRLNQVALSTHSISNFTTPNPPPGIEVNYSLQTAARAPAVITITGADGRVVDRLRGPARAGLNRVIWPLRYAPATPFANLRRPGPLVAPGAFTITVAAAGETQTVSAAVRPDPRFPDNPANFAAETRAGLEARRLRSALDVLLGRLMALHRQLALRQQLTRPPDPAAAALDRRVLAQLGASYNLRVQPGSEDWIHYKTTIGDLLAKAEARLTPGYDLPPDPRALALLTRERRAIALARARFNRLLATRVAAYNRQALARHAATLAVGAPLPPLRGH